MVGMLTFYTDDLSSNPVEVYSFFVKTLFEKNEIKQKDAHPSWKNPSRLFDFSVFSTIPTFYFEFSLDQNDIQIRPNLILKIYLPRNNFDFDFIFQKYFCIKSVFL